MHVFPITPKYSEGKVHETLLPKANLKWFEMIKEGYMWTLQLETWTKKGFQNTKTFLSIGVCVNLKRLGLDHAITRQTPPPYDGAGQPIIGIKGAPSKMTFSQAARRTPCFATCRSICA